MAFYYSINIQSQILKIKVKETIIRIAQSLNILFSYKIMG